MARGAGDGGKREAASPCGRQAALQLALGLPDLTERLLEVAAVVAEELGEAGLTPVVVGGPAVAYWTEAAFVSHDIDVLAPSTAEFQERLAALGFERAGRYWVAPGGGVVLEAPGSYPAPDEQVVEVKLASGRSIRILSLEDVLIDRLHQFRGGGHGDVYAQTVFLLALPELDRTRLAERASSERLEGALALVEGAQAEFASRGRPPEPWELHDLARSLP